MVQYKKNHMHEMPALIGSRESDQAFTFPCSVMEWSLQTHASITRLTCRYHKEDRSPCSCRLQKSIDFVCCLNKEPLFWEKFDKVWSVGEHKRVQWLPTLHRAIVCGPDCRSESAAWKIPKPNMLHLSATKSYHLNLLVL